MDNHELDDVEEGIVDAEFIVLEDEFSSARPPAVIDRARALAARLLCTPDPQRKTLPSAIAQARAEQRNAVANAFTAWEAALPRRAAREMTRLDQSPPVPSSHDH